MGGTVARTNQRTLRYLFAVVATVALAATAALPASASDGTDPPPPAVPTGLATEVSHDLVTLSWDDPGDPTISGYVILRRDKAIHPQGTFVTLAPHTHSTATSYIDASIDPERRYVYRVKAVSPAGTSDRSSWARAYTPVAPEPSPALPARPTGLATEPSHDTVALSWDDPADPTVTGYVILRRDKDVHPQGTFQTINPDTAAAATSYTDATAEPERRYVYRIKAVNTHGYSTISSWARGYTPAAPQAVFIDGDNQNDQSRDDPAGMPGNGTPPGPGTRANVSEGNDDLPATTATTGQVDVGGTVTGNASSSSDRDWFAVELEAGTRYQIDLEGADTNRGTLTNPHFWNLFDAGGNAISSTMNGDSGVGDNARTIYTATADGTHYVEAAANGAPGTYTLSVIVLGANGVSEADFDFPTTAATTGRVEVGGSVTGNLGNGTDIDGFLVDLEARKRYRFDLESARTGRGTLPDPYLTLYDGDEGYIDEDDDGGEGYNSRLTFKSPAAGTYLLTAESASGDSGTYTLSVRALGALPVAVPPGGLGPRGVPGAVRDVEVSYRSSIGQIVWWDAPDETVTGAQWISAFRIYGAGSSGGCDGYLLDEYVVDYLGFTTPPTDSNGNPTGFKYFKQVDVGPVRFGVTAVNALGEGPCAEGPDDPPDPINYDEAACKLNPGDIWCGVVTVGDITHNGNTIAHGFLDDPVRGGGELVDNTGDTELFTGLKVYTVKGIYVGSAGILDGVLFFLLDEDFSDDELAALALHIDVDGTTLQLDIVTNGVTTTSDTWPFSETDTFSAIEGQYAWTGENLDDWSTATTVTVRLRGTDNS